MIIYIICFLISCLLLKASSKVKSKKWLYYTLNTIAVLLPCLLAALRSTTIGTDVEVYLSKIFEKASSSTNFSDYLNGSWWLIYRTRHVYDYEIGFTLLVYVIQKITNNIHFVLFFIQALIVVPIYLGLRKIEGFENKIPFAMLIFYLSLYNTSLNIMRQMISVSIIFYGTCCLMYSKRGTIKFLVSYVLACLFHSSSIFYIAILILYKILNLKIGERVYLKITDKIKISYKGIVFIVTTLISLLVLFNTDFLLECISALGMEQYRVWMKGDFNFSWSKVIRVLPIIAALFVCGKYYIKKEKNAYMYIILFVLAVIISEFSSINIYGERLSYVFQIFNIILVPTLCSVHPNKNVNRVLKILMICYYFAYWYYYFAYTNSSETIPYKFFWQ